MLPELRTALKGGKTAPRSVPNIHLAFYGWTLVLGFCVGFWPVLRIEDSTAFELVLSGLGHFAFWLALCSAWVALVLVLEATFPKLQKTSWIHVPPFAAVSIFALNALLFVRAETHFVRAVPYLFWRGYRDHVPALSALGLDRFYLLGTLALTITLGVVGGIYFHRWITRLAKRGQVQVHPAVGVFLAVGALFFQIIEERWGSNLKHRSFVLASRAASPVTLGVGGEPKPILSFALSVRGSRMEDDIQNEMKKFDLSTVEKKSVFVIVVDSLSPVSVTAQMAPHLNSFFQSSANYPLAFSSAYDPELAFVSLLTGNHSFSSLLPANIAATTGSAPLRVLRELGYQTTVLSRTLSPDLERRVLGNSRALASRFDAQAGSSSAAEGDLMLTNDFIERLKAAPEGLPQFMVIQLASARWPYEWPREFGATFSPYFETFDSALLLSSATEKLLIANRYANSLRYVDAQVGRLIEALKAKGIYDQSVIAVLGSIPATYPRNTLAPPVGLRDENLAVPLAIHFGGAEPPPTPGQGLVSTVHVLPTILQHLGVRGTFTKLFDGSSVLEAQPQMLFAVAGNAASDPAVMVRKGGWKTFWNIEKDASAQFKKLHLISITKGDDTPVPGMNFSSAASIFIEREFKELFGAGEPPADALPFLLVPGN